MSGAPGLYVKRSRCHQCGAWKATPSTNSYVYCDYCAALIDWDFKAALASGNAAPGPMYEALVARLQPEIQAAKQSGDRVRYGAAQRQIYSAFADACPASHSPRIKDPEYRRDFIEYTVSTTTLQDFDPVCDAAMTRMMAEAGRIQWAHGGGKLRAESTSFWRMFASVTARIDACLDMNEKTGLMGKHPDKPTREVLRKIGLTALVQGWLQYLGPEDQERVLAETGLKGDYTHVAPPPMTGFKCGACGCESRVVVGAKRVECQGCRKVSDVGTSELPCGHCGARVPVPPGQTILKCPYCKSELRAMQ